MKMRFLLVESQAKPPRKWMFQTRTRIIATTPSACTTNVNGVAATLNAIIIASNCVSFVSPSFFSTFFPKLTQYLLRGGTQYKSDKVFFFSFFIYLFYFIFYRCVSFTWSLNIPPNMLKLNSSGPCDGEIDDDGLGGTWELLMGRS